MTLPRLDTGDWQTPTPLTFVLTAVAIVATQTVALVAMGHPLLCECGHVELWHASASGPETSQHLTDWYSITHVVHGFLFYLLLWLIAPGAPFGIVMLMALGLEAGWEIVENTPAVIERYRQTALAAGYFGDSVVNSVADTVAMATGLLWARLAPTWSSIVLVLGLEILLAILIQDNLTLNIIQLVYPIEAITEWQTGG